MTISMSCRVCNFFEMIGWSTAAESVWYIGFILLFVSMFIWPMALIVWPAMLVFVLVDALRVASCHSCSIGH